MRSHDYALLAAGLTRSCLWLVGLFYALRFRRALVAAGFALTFASSSAFAFLNAGFAAPPRTLEVASYVATAAVTLIVAGFILGTSLYTRRKDWTA